MNPGQIIFNTEVLTSAGVVGGPVLAGHAHHLWARGLVSLLAADLAACPHHVAVVLSSGCATAHIPVFHLNGRAPRCPCTKTNGADLPGVCSVEQRVLEDEDVSAQLNTLLPEESTWNPPIIWAQTDTLDFITLRATPHTRPWGTDDSLTWVKGRWWCVACVITSYNEAKAR